MTEASGTKVLWTPLRFLAAVLVCLGVGHAHAGDANTNPAMALRAKYGALQEQLGHNQFRRPLFLDSSELHEMEQGEYLDMKRNEHLRQQAEARATTRPAPGV